MRSGFVGLVLPVMVIVIATVGSVASGCSGTQARSQAGGPCSISSDDDPHYTCDPTRDIICINTMANGRYFCRDFCEVGDGRCQPGEVCCPGKISGTTYGYMRGCTTPMQCETSTAPDGGVGG